MSQQCYSFVRAGLACGVPDYIPLVSIINEVVDAYKWEGVYQVL